MNWYVSCVIMSDGKGNFFVFFYNYLFNSCLQDWFFVLFILESFLIIVCFLNLKVKKVYLKLDEVGCYYNSQFIVVVCDVGECVGVLFQRYDFFELQFGKDVCDRILCFLKGVIRRFCNEGYDVFIVSDMYMVFKERLV